MPFFFLSPMMICGSHIHKQHLFNVSLIVGIFLVVLQQELELQEKAVLCQTYTPHKAKKTCYFSRMIDEELLSQCQKLSVMTHSHRSGMRMWYCVWYCFSQWPKIVFFSSTTFHFWRIRLCSLRFFSYIFLSVQHLIATLPARALCAIVPFITQHMLLITSRLTSHLTLTWHCFGGPWTLTCLVLLQKIHLAWYRSSLLFWPPSSPHSPATRPAFRPNEMSHPETVHRHSNSPFCDLMVTIDA